MSLLGPTPRECDCESGEIREAEYDGHGIFLFYCCDKCRDEKLGRFRPNAMSNRISKAPITGIQELDSMIFYEKTIKDTGAKLLVSECNEAFWNLRSYHGPELLKAGITISHYGSKWSVCWWKRSEGYDIPILNNATET